MAADALLSQVMGSLQMVSWYVSYMTALQK